MLNGTDTIYAANSLTVFLGPEKRSSPSLMAPAFRLCSARELAASACRPASMTFLLTLSWCMVYVPRRWYHNRIQRRCCRNAAFRRPKPCCALAPKGYPLNHPATPGPVSGCKRIHQRFSSCTKRAINGFPVAVWHTQSFLYIPIVSLIHSFR